MLLVGLTQKMLCIRLSLSQKKLKIWVENRVSEITEDVGVDCCRYVPTDCNSANVATRYNKKLKFEEMLWCGERVHQFFVKGKRCDRSQN